MLSAESEKASIASRKNSATLHAYQYFPPMDSSEVVPETPSSPLPEEKKRRLRIRALSSDAAKHVLKHAHSTSRDFFYQTTLEERVIILSSIAAIILAWMPWAVSSAGGTLVDVTGVTSFLYFMGILVILSAVAALWSIVWVLMEKPLPRIIENPGHFHFLLGLEITQIGLIAFTMLKASFSLTQDLEAKTVTLIALMIAGVAIMGAALFEQSKHRSKTVSKVITTHHHMHDHENSDEELENILGGGNRED